MADEFDRVCNDLDAAQRALVMLANQLEAHGIPFVPAAEAATAMARRDVAENDRLIEIGVGVGTEALAARKAARAAARQGR